MILWIEVAIRFNSVRVLTAGPDSNAGSGFTGSDLLIGFRELLSIGTSRSTLDHGWIEPKSCSDEVDASWCSWPG